MYGSDWPVSRLADGVDYEEVIQLLRDLIKDRSEEDKKSIFRDNAIRCRLYNVYVYRPEINFSCHNFR
jgi:predicted TIM-barrel fold metal-dependent hydrolase